MVESGSLDGGWGVAYVPPPPVAAMYDLRPLTTGEILDRTFSLYRRRFWLYCGLSAISASLLGVMQITQYMFLGRGGVGSQAVGTPAAGAAVGMLPNKLMVYGLLGTMVTLVLYVVAYAMTQAATVSAVSTLYLGHETTLGKALKVVGHKWWRYILIALWQGWSAMWIFMLLLVPAVILVATKVDGLIFVGVVLMVVAVLSIFYGIVAYLRNALAISASVFEGLSVRKSMRRSKTLARGRLWGLFLLSLLLYVLNLVAGGLRIPFALLMSYGPKNLHLVSEALTVLMTFLTGALVAPVGAIALCLFYIDQRVRLEGFDLEAMMDPTIGSGALPRVAPPPPPPVVGGGFAPSGFTASGFTAEAAPFAPSGFTAPTEPAGDGS